MPLVAYSSLPTFERLRREGERVIARDHALQQDIRELHVGLLNMMPDTALEVTERQFFRLIGGSNQIVQFYMHPFSLDSLPRAENTQEHIRRYYESFEQIKEQGLDALIITGATPGPDLAKLPFWKPLIKVVDWAYENVTSTLCSCLATHAVMEFRYKQKRRALGFKRWGVFPHQVLARKHPLMHGVNTRFDVPHSRFFDISRLQFEAAGLSVLVESEEAGVHLATSEDLFRLVFFQGHPEYDSNSILKEYKREIRSFVAGERADYPPFPDNYFTSQVEAILAEHQDQVQDAKNSKLAIPELPEDLVRAGLDNTWHDSAEAVLNNWIGQVYQITHIDRKKPFQDGIDPKDPLGVKAKMQ